MIQGKRVRQSTKCSDRKDAEQWVKDMVPITTATSKKALASTMQDILFTGDVILIDDVYEVYLKMYRARRKQAKNEGPRKSAWDDFKEFLRVEKPDVKMAHEVTLDNAQGYIEYLTENGIDPQIITSKGFGKSRPIVPGTSAEAQAQNRRVEIGVVDTVISYEERVSSLE